MGIQLAGLNDDGERFFFAEGDLDFFLGMMMMTMMMISGDWL